MKILRVILLILVLVIVVVAVGGLVIFNDWTRGPLPQHDGQITITTPAGAQSTIRLSAPVEIIRDNWGIPHLYASTSYDLFFAQGYTQAQDRWWQMEFSRAVGDGRIEELTGKNETAFGNDVFIRTIGWRRVAEKEAASYDAESIAILQAFADGVNAYIFSRPAGDLALEYNLLGLIGVNVPIRPWTPADTIVWGKVMAWNLSGNREEELLRSELMDKLGSDMTADFIPPWPFGEKPTVLQPEDLPISEASLKVPSNSSTGIASVNTLLAGNITPTSDLFRQPPGIGSNNWVIAGTRTATGTPLLADDPHLGIQMPSIWYEVGLHCQPVTPECPYNVVGFALPAAPGVIIGHNDHIGWGVTNVGPDTQDLYLLRINPENELQYEWNGGWRDMTVYEETIRFGDGEPPVTIKVRETHLGPIINDNQLDEATGQPTGFNNEDPMALRWTALDTGTLLQAVARLNRAQNWDDFRAALRYWDVPSQNFVYADVDGNIGYQTPGLIPIRAEGHSGQLPIDGTTGQYEWKGFIPFDDLPRALNPDRGYIATANQAVVPLGYYDQLREKLADQFGINSNYFISQSWAYGYRGQRIVEMLEASNQHTIQTIQAIQGDNKMISAEELMPYLKDLDLGDSKYNDARDWMLNWDYQMRMDSPQAGLYAYFWHALLKNLFSDQLGDIIGPDEGGQGMWTVFLLMEEPDNTWWDDTTTADTTETRDDILVRSFREAYDLIQQDRGENRDNWQWGSFHTATFVSNPLGLSGINLIENIVNRGPVMTGGGSEIVNATGWNYEASGYTVRSLPSMRMILDIGSWSNSVTMHTTGQSGHPYSPHYADMIDSWRNIQYHPMLWTREQVEAAAASRLTLTPG